MYIFQIMNKFKYGKFCIESNEILRFQRNCIFKNYVLYNKFHLKKALLFSKINFNCANIILIAKNRRNNKMNG